MNRNILLHLLLCCLLWNCQFEPKRFVQLQSKITGVTFKNTIVTNDSLNAMQYAYVYNGGGVGIGDLNGDGWEDLFFAGNQVSSRLYLNKGEVGEPIGFAFEDISEIAKVETNRWCTGVALVDINQDGRLDIYVSVAGFRVPKSEMENLLFINEGNDNQNRPIFSEQAAAYGLNDDGYSTQAAFLDYDLDGDLDVYLLTNALERAHSNLIREKRTDGSAASTDRLYRNEGNGQFKNVSEEAGILIEGYGLGIAVSDLNFDGFPDIYAANDFISNDLVWINQGNGTFRNEAANYLRHQTHNGMGVDIADINNDMLPDIAVLDMLPESNYRQKMMIPYISPNQFSMKQQMGYEDQYMRNTLQLNRGKLPNGEVRFSEVGNLAGVAATDWSWSVLLADYDNDSWKDLFITNGYRKDVTNLDFINYSSYNQMVGTEETREVEALKILEEMPDVRIDNYLYRNKGNLQFENVAAAWGLDGMSFTNGAAYADLDKDGDLDLVTNNLDQEAFVYENKTTELANHFLQIQLEQNPYAAIAYQSKVLVYQNGKTQYQEQSIYRGFKSSVSPILHFGLGDHSLVDSILVFWSDGRMSRLTNVESDQKIVIQHQNDLPKRSFSPFQKNALWQWTTMDSLLVYQHKSSSYSSLSNTSTLIHDEAKISPTMAKGDLNGDGLEDVCIVDQKVSIFLQQQQGHFEPIDLAENTDKQASDVLLFDLDEDGDLDIYVAYTAQTRFATKETLQDVIYVNDGTAHFTQQIQGQQVNTNCLAAADYDEDGDIDIFVGVEDGESYILQNENGRLEQSNHSFKIPDIKDAIWTDFNNDDQLDLIAVGHWMPIRFFAQQNGNFEEVFPTLTHSKTTDFSELNTFAFHINATDIDGDGDEDYLIGNLGQNSKLKASAKHPITLFNKDFDNNGALDPLVAIYVDDEQILLHERDLLIKQIPSIKSRFPDYETYAKADVAHTLSEEDVADAPTSFVHYQASCLLEQTPNGFNLHELPTATQFAPLMSSVFFDINKDGQLDIICAGNYQATETNQIGYYDASYGTVLLQTDPFVFEATPDIFISEGDVRELLMLSKNEAESLLFVAKRNATLEVIHLQTTPPFN